MTSTAEHLRSFRAIDAHFARRASRTQTRELYAHLPGCAVCARRYERHLLLSRLDPAAPSAEERLAAGLGLRPARPSRVGFAALVVAAATALVVWWPGAAHRADVEPVARGGGAPASLLVYQVEGGAPALAGRRIHAGDELAFAYSNPRGRRYLLVFGADEHGHVYWFHPAWPPGAPPPAAVEARPGPGPHELPEAIRHHLDGRRLRVTAVLSDERLGVGAVERDGRELPLPTSGDVQVVTRSFEVEP